MRTLSSDRPVGSAAEVEPGFLNDVFALGKPSVTGMNVVMALVVAGAFVLVSLVVEKYNRAADVDAGAAAAC